MKKVKKYHVAKNVKVMDDAVKTQKVKYGTKGKKAKVSIEQE